MFGILIMIMIIGAILASTMTLEPFTGFNSGAGFTHGDVSGVFRKKCRIYIAKGDFVTENIPPALGDVLELYQVEDLPDPPAPVFQPLGTLTENMSKIDWEQEEIKIDFGSIPGNCNLTAEFNSANVTPAMIGFLDTAEAKGPVSFLIVPDGDTTGEYFLALTGVKFRTKGSMPHDGKMSSITLVIAESTNNISDKLLFKKFAA